MIKVHWIIFGMFAIHIIYIYLTGVHDASNSIEGLNMSNQLKQSFYISSIMFCNNTFLPDPDGPRMILRIGNLPTTWYLLCMTVYYCTLIGVIFGVDIYIKCIIIVFA